VGTRRNARKVHAFEETTPIILPGTAGVQAQSVSASSCPGAAAGDEPLRGKDSGRPKEASGRYPLTITPPVSGLLGPPGTWLPWNLERSLGLGTIGGMDPTVTGADREMIAWHRARSLGALVARILLADAPSPDQCYLLATGLRYAGDLLERSCVRSQPPRHCRPRSSFDAEQAVSGTARICLRKVVHRSSYRE